MKPRIHRPPAGPSTPALSCRDQCTPEPEKQQHRRAEQARRTAATRAGAPLLIQAPGTWDQSLANRDIYTLVKVGRC